MGCLLKAVMASWKARTRTAFGKHVPPPERRDLSSELLASSSGLQDRLEGLQALLKQAQCALQEDLSLARSPLGDKVSRLAGEQESCAASATAFFSINGFEGARCSVT